MIGVVIRNVRLLEVRTVSTTVTVIPKAFDATQDKVTRPAARVSTFRSKLRLKLVATILARVLRVYGPVVRASGFMTSTTDNAVMSNVATTSYHYFLEA